MKTIGLFDNIKGDTLNDPVINGSIWLRIMFFTSRVDQGISDRFELRLWYEE